MIHYCNPKLHMPQYTLQRPPATNGETSSRRPPVWLTLFAEFWLSLFDAGDEHVSDAGRRQTVEAATDGVHGDHIQVLGAWRGDDERSEQM